MGTSVQYLKGVGPVRARQLARLGIYSLTDLVNHYPRAYHVRPRINISSLPDYAGKQILITGKIIGPPVERLRQVKLLQATLSDGTGLARCTWFNQNYLKNRLKPGLTVSVAGKFSREYGNLVVEELGLEGSLSEIQPLYNLTEGISNSVMQGIIQSGLREYRKVDILPPDFLDIHKLLPIYQALTTIHSPQSQAELNAARYSLKFRELFLYQLSFLYWRKSKLQIRGYEHRLCPDLLPTLEDAYGFKFTEDQLRAIAEIEENLTHPLPMNRLLQGDVGSGKTAVASHALFTSALNGFKAVFMVPTEIVASQHYATLQRAGNMLNCPVLLLTGSTTKTERDKIHTHLNRPGGMVMVGTHAVFQEQVNIAGLALVITDEQHRFGVHQRLALAEKGNNPHVLVMSATPIPRTLAMTIYGDLDVSTIQAKPGGRKPIKTYVVHSNRRQKVFDFISKEMAAGNVGYIVCPLIEESDKIDALSLDKYQEVLKQGLPHWCKFGILHGRMSGSEKEEVISELKAGKIQLLLATTVVEVGVDVGNATFIVIEDSQRFGLAQLHQLRGRVGRREKQSYCFLIAEGETDRLKILENSNDGSAVAMADMQVRGSGQFLGHRQHGLNEFRIADIIADAEIAKLSRAAATDIVEILDTASQWRELYDLVKKKIANLKS